MQPECENALQHAFSSFASLSNKQNPEYRNSGKEAIPAVKLLRKIIAENPKATLGGALKVTEEKKCINMQQRYHGNCKSNSELKDIIVIVKTPPKAGNDLIA